MIKFSACYLESFWSQTASPAEDGGDCCRDVMGDVVLDRLLCATELSYDRKFYKKCFEGTLWLPANSVGLGKDTCGRIPCTARLVTVSVRWLHLMSTSRL